MNVLGVENRLPQGLAIGWQRYPDRDMEKQSAAAAPVAEADDSKSPVGIVGDDVVETTVVESGTGEGALRLLQAGHFQGVADLRLRINFHEELAVRQEQAVMQVVEEHMSIVMTTVSGQVDGLLGSGDLTDVQTDSVYEVLMIFQSSLTMTATADTSLSTLSAQSPTGESLIAELQSAFTSLWDSLETLLMQSAVTEPGAQTPTDVLALGDLSASSLSLSATVTRVTVELRTTTVELVTDDETPDFQAFLDTLRHDGSDRVDQHPPRTLGADRERRGLRQVSCDLQRVVGRRRFGTRAGERPGQSDGVASVTIFRSKIPLDASGGSPGAFHVSH